MSFLQIHTLTSYPAVLLNRDNVGFAKRVPFGGATRLRVSSQCLKRHWRTFDGDDAIIGCELPDGFEALSVRSRRSFAKHIYQPLVDRGIAPLLAADATALMMILATQSGEPKKFIGKWKELQKARTKAPSEPAQVHTDQPTVFGEVELRYLADEARKICERCGTPDAIWDVGESFLKGKDEITKAWRANIRSLAHAAGVDAALFGRMVTSDMFARGDAAIHVAHAFTVHPEHTESDYFSVVDDLAREEGETGSGHINETELTSGLYYGYVVVDVPLLVSNLEGGDRKEWRGKDRALAAEVVRRLAHLVATVSPGAKLGSTAPYAYAHFMMAEWGTAQPRTLANAFEAPVVSRAGMLGGAYDKLAGYVKDVDSAYGKRTERRMLAVQAADSLIDLGAEKGSLDQLAAFCAQKVKA